MPGGGWTFDRASGALLNARENNQARFRYSDTTMTLKVGTSETTFPGNWLQPPVPNALQWTDLQPETLKTLIITNWSVNDYVAFLRHEDETRFLDASGLNMRLTIERYLVGGSFTLPSDHPTSGTKSYLVGVSSSSPTRDGAGGFFTNESLRMDFSGSTFTATLPLEQISWITGKAPLKTTMQLSGTLNRATGRLEGTITTPDGTYHGLFAGAFFGPQAAEIGLAFSLVKDNGIGVAGYIGTNRK